jgi:aminoglycoside 6-adenylyltransferase
VPGVNFLTFQPPKENVKNVKPGTGFSREADVTKEMVSRIVGWGAAEEGVRAMILTGSRAGKEPTDELSDYDIALFVTDSEPYTSADSWISSLDDVWVYVPATAMYKDEEYATRLIIFRDGVKVDFSFLSVKALRDIVAASPLPADYDLGYRVLLDKDGVTSGMIAPQFAAYRGGRPAESEYMDCIREFWFEAYHVIKYLKRGDLWLAKFRDWATKEHLIRMIQWHEKGKHNWEYRTHPLGKEMKSWADPDTWRTLHRCFGHFDGEDSRDAMLETCRLFGRIARETAELLSCTYPEYIERNIVSFAERLLCRDSP